MYEFNIGKTIREAIEHIRMNGDIEESIVMTKNALKKVYSEQGKHFKQFEKSVDVEIEEMGYGVIVGKYYGLDLYLSKENAIHIWHYNYWDRVR